MKLWMMHGRLRPDTGGTDIDGNEIEDWGFEGPTITGLHDMVITYQQMELLFDSDLSFAEAKRLTGWSDGVRDWSLVPRYGGDCLRIWNKDRNRAEYFGDWGIEC